MALVIWTEPALSDLNEIANYIALDKFNAAQRLIQQVFTSVERLDQFPESGRIPSELEHSQYRGIIVGPCRIFCRSDSKQDKVFILYVMRGERLLRKYLIDERA